jgi:hypothetical protein
LKQLNFLKGGNMQPLDSDSGFERESIGKLPIDMTSREIKDYIGSGVPNEIVKENASKLQSKGASGPSHLASAAKLLMKIVTTPPAVAMTVGGGVIAAGAAPFVLVPAAIGASIGIGIGMAVDKLQGNQQSKAAEIGAKWGGAIAGGLSTALFAPIVILGLFGGMIALAGGSHLYTNVLEKKKLEEPAPEDIFQGGHAGVFKQKGEFLEKTTFAGEVNLYYAISSMTEFSPLQEITPKTRNPDLTKNTVEMENLTVGFQEDGRDILDIKLGRTTYSNDVDQIRKGKKDWVKNVLVGMKDAIIGRTFRVTKGKQGTMGRLAVAKRSDQILVDVLNKHPELKQKLLLELENVRGKMGDVPLAFLGHSVLIVMGKDQEGNPKLNVKLIDIGNYVSQEEAEANHVYHTYLTLRDNNLQAINDLVNLIKDHHPNPF